MEGPIGANRLVSYSVSRCFRIDSNKTKNKAYCHCKLCGSGCARGEATAAVISRRLANQFLSAYLCSQCVSNIDVLIGDVSDLVNV